PNIEAASPATPGPGTTHHQYSELLSNWSGLNVAIPEEPVLLLMYFGVWGVVELKRRLSGSIEWSITGKAICLRSVVVRQKKANRR
ncbi:hypothetical protein M1719_28675, partial [Salmonella enterica subsp. enterica serovar Give]|nr:hypothetical protein [Salmonella enterica subsp. enterica serovar Give]